MKMSATHFDALQAAISRLDTPKARARYVAGDFPRAELVGDLDKRYRWDLFWETFSGNLYDALDDSHIDTALRRIVPPLEVS